MTIIIDQAKRTRKCGNCNNEIDPKEYHLLVETFYRRTNICQYCLQDLADNVITFNKEEEGNERNQKIANM
jgi:hypothetical protein